MADRQLISKDQNHIPGILTTDAELLTYFEKVLDNKKTANVPLSWISMKIDCKLTAESIGTASSRLHSAGATFLVILHPECHLLQSAIRQDISLHWVSMTEVCTREILRLNADRIRPTNVGILTSCVSQTGAYKKKFEANNFRVSEETYPIDFSSPDKIHGISSTLIKAIQKFEEARVDFVVPETYEAVRGLRAREAIYEKRMDLKYLLSWLDPYSLLADTVAKVALGVEEPYFIY